MRGPVPPSAPTALALALALPLVAACPNGTPERPYPEPEADEVLTYLRAQNESARSIDAKTEMDYWVGGERVRGTVLLRAERGAKVRINALTAGDAVAADLACDGRDFTLVDHGDDCLLTGPCDARSIGQLLGVWLEPDELLLLSLGGVPLLADAEVSVTWDEDRDAEKVRLSGPQGRIQRVFLDKSGEHWDVAEAVLERPDGETEWELENRDFETLEAADGAVFRAPSRSRFQQPVDDADLAVRWEERDANPELDPASFELDPPALPSC